MTYRPDISGDSLHHDYFRSADFERGHPWVVIDNGLWILLLPEIPPEKPRRVIARPVVDEGEPDGWRWRLEIGAWALPVPAHCMSPARPEPPPSGGRYVRFCSLAIRYVTDTELGPYLFGHLKAGLQLWHECPLIITRPPRPQEADLID